VQVFGRRNAETIDALGRPAFKKRQGTKSREGIRVAVRRALSRTEQARNFGFEAGRFSRWLLADAWMLLGAFRSQKVGSRLGRCDMIRLFGTN
jgi:hypothetical protein